MTIPEIEEKLKIGQVSPHELAQMKDYLAGISSSLMDKELEYQIDYACFYRDTRDSVSSDKAVKMKWLVTLSGRLELETEITQKKIKVLINSITSHLRVSHDEAFNRM